MKHSTLWNQFQTIWSVCFNPYTTRNIRVHTQQCGRWRMVISMLKIRRPLGRLIFNMGIAIPGKTVFLIETAPLASKALCQQHPQCWSAIHPYWMSLKQFTQCGLTHKQLETQRYILRHVATNIMVHKHHATSKSVPIKCSLCLTSFMAVYSMNEPLNHWKCMGALHTQHCGSWCCGVKAPGHQHPQCWWNSLPYGTSLKKILSMV